MLPAVGHLWIPARVALGRDDKGWLNHLQTTVRHSPLSVIPAKAGTQDSQQAAGHPWIPVFTGMAVKEKCCNSQLGTRNRYAIPHGLQEIMMSSK
ncbi:MAG: hypothetical protein QNK29_02580 [Desulfobacterales bacterium]|nr:hypothetical protein [Desulfobacterales bacterium]